MIVPGIIGGVLSWFIILLVLYALTSDALSAGSFIKFNLRILPIWIAYVVFASIVATMLLTMK